MPRKTLALILVSCLILEPLSAAWGAGSVSSRGGISPIGVARFSPAPMEWIKTLQESGVTLPLDPLVYRLRSQGVSIQAWSNNLVQRPAWIAQASESIERKMGPISSAMLTSVTNLDPSKLGPGRRLHLRENMHRIAAALAVNKPSSELEGILDAVQAPTAPSRKVIPLSKPLADTERAPPLEKEPRSPEQAPKIKQSRGILGKINHAVKLASFAVLTTVMFRGAPPVIVSDIDETLVNGQEPVAGPLVKSIANILRYAGKFPLLTGNNVNRAKTFVLDPLKAELGKGEEHLLGQVPLGAKSGAEIYSYRRGQYELDESIDFAQAIGLKAIDEAKKIMQEASRRFDFDGEARRVLGKGIQGDMILERRTTWKGKEILNLLILLPTGQNVAEEERIRYERSGASQKRLSYAAYINQEFQKAGIPLKAVVSGKTSIDIGLASIDKGYALKKLARKLGTSPRRLIYSGDSMSPGENDEPAAREAGLVINVGKKPKIKLGPIVFNEDQAGPEGLLPYLKVIEHYARTTAILRKHD
jgi:HAD superfamily hydrolase (TIGR01484 family)